MFLFFKILYSSLVIEIVFSNSFISVTLNLFSAIIFDGIPLYPVETLKLLISEFIKPET